MLGECISAILSAANTENNTLITLLMFLLLLLGTTIRMMNGGPEEFFWVSQRKSATQLTFSTELCLDVPRRVSLSPFYACQDEWLSALLPSCQLHRREGEREHRSLRGLSNGHLHPPALPFQALGTTRVRYVPAVILGSTQR